MTRPATPYESTDVPVARSQDKIRELLRRAGAEGVQFDEEWGETPKFRLIEETIRLSRAAFRASAFSGQGDGANFCEAPARDRKEWLAEILQLQVWSRLLDRTRADAGAAVEQTTRLQAQTAVREETTARKAEVRQRLDELERAEQTARANAEQAQAELEAAQATRASADAAVARAAAAAAELRRVEAETTRLRADLDEAQLAETALPQRRAQLEKAHAAVELVRGLEQELTEALAEAEARREHERLVVERNRLLGEASERNERAHALRQEAALLEENGPGATTCDRCGQVLGAEALAATLVSYRAEADQLDKQAADHDEQAAHIPLEAAAEKLTAPGARPVGNIEHDLRQARHAVEQRPLLEAQIAELEQATGRLPELVEKIQAARQEVAAAAAATVALAEVPDTVELDRNVTLAREAVNVRRTDHENLTRQLATCQHDMAAIHTAEGELADLRQQTQRTQVDLDLYRLAEKAYGRDGIPALILENVAIPQIEAEANRMLEQMPMSDGRVYHVELRTQRALKSRDGTADALDIIVVDELGARSFETYSGGERARLSYGLRLGLHRLLANRPGCEVKWLSLDEPEGLEEEAMLQLVQVLRAHEREFGKVLVTSHHPILQSAFDRQIVMVNEGGWSRVASAAAEPAGVAA